MTDLPDLVDDTEQTKIEVNENIITDPQKNEDDKDRNWKAFLEQRKQETKQLEQERERNKQLEADKEKRSREIEDLKIALQAVADRKESSNYFDDSADQNKIIEDRVEKILSQKDSERRKREDEDRFRRESLEIKNQMPDLIEVCSQENIAYLEYYHPEIAIPLSKMQDGFEKTKLAYQAIRKHVKMNKKEAQKIESNLSKPKSVHSPLSNETQKEESSGHLSDKKRNEVWNKMQRLISGEDED